MITVYTGFEKQVINIGTKSIYSLVFNFTHNTISTIIKHEFGHALGLDHKIETSENNFKSIMHPNAADMGNITTHDVKAVKLLYPNGFQKYYNTAKPERYEP